MRLTVAHIGEPSEKRREIRESENASLAGSGLGAPGYPPGTTQVLGT